MSQTRKGPPHGWFGYVYLLQCGDLYKIGFSLQPRKRLKQFRTGSPHPILLIHSLRTSCYRQIERQLHHHFRGKRESGEWFKLDPEDVSYIKSLNKSGFTPEEQARRDRDEVEYRKVSDARYAEQCRAEARDAIVIVAGV